MYSKPENTLNILLKLMYKVYIIPKKNYFNHLQR